MKGCFADRFFTQNCTGTLEDQVLGFISSHLISSHLNVLGAGLCPVYFLVLQWSVMVPLLPSMVTLLLLMTAHAPRLVLIGRLCTDSLFKYLPGCGGECYCAVVV